MRRISSVVIAAALALTVTVSLTASTAKAAIGYDSSYQFESAFLTLGPGDNGTFAVFFANTGAPLGSKERAPRSTSPSAIAPRSPATFFRSTPRSRVVGCRRPRMRRTPRTS